MRFPWNQWLRQKRGAIQAAASLLSNIHLPNFLSASLYTGPLKKVCLPGLNCYSCPGATGACPIGSFQAVVGSPKFSFSYYILGLGMIFGLVFGRFICGFLCPFGFFQDLLHKIPSPKWFTQRLKAMRLLKYVILIGVVWGLGVLLVHLTGMSSPAFCKYLCPQGILQGAIPLAMRDPS